MTAPLLELDRVSYAFPGRMLLRRITWHIAPGERWAVLGPNGAGKTTLLQLALGLLWPNRGGRIRRHGETHTDLREFHCRVGFVSTGLLAQVPGDEPVLRTIISGKFAQFGLWERPWNPPRRTDYASARALLRTCGLTRFAHREFGTLSQGEQQSVLIARALMATPVLLVLDEPCAGLDPGARANVLATLARLCRRAPQLAMVYVTHHIEEIIPAFSRTLILADGRAETGSTRALLTAARLSRLYRVPCRVRRWQGRHHLIVRDRVR